MSRLGGVTLLLGLLLGCSNSEDSQSFVSGVFVAENLKLCSEIATTFLAEELDWGLDEYRLEYDGIEDEITHFRATHRSDIEAASYGKVGGGESREIRVRCTSGEVVQVLGYQ